jgi:hypothetical protein
VVSWGNKTADQPKMLIKKTAPKANQIVFFDIICICPSPLYYLFRKGLLSTLLVPKAYYLLPVDSSFVTRNS